MILARSLGPAARGELATVLLWVAFLGMAGDMGLGFAFSYFAGKNVSRVGRLWGVALQVSATTGSVLAIVGMVCLPRILGTPSDTVVSGFRIALLSLPFTLASGHQSFLLLGAGLVRRFNCVRLFLSLAYAVGIALLWVMGRAGVLAYVRVFLVVQILGCVFAFALLASRFKLKCGGGEVRLSELFGYGMKTFFSSVAGQVSLRIDQLLMSIFLNPVQLGNYVVAVALSAVPGPLFSSLGIVALPRITQAPDRQAAGKEALRLVLFGLLAGGAASILGVIAVPRVLPLVFGAAYSASVLSAQVLLVATLFQGLNLIQGNSLRALGYPGRPAVAEGIGMVISLVLLALLLPRMGILGAAVASLAAYAMIFGLQLLLLLRSSDLEGRRLLEYFNWKRGN